MKLIFAFGVFLTSFAAAFAADGPAASTKQTATNAAVQPEETNAAPKIPGDLFTNSVGMELVKIQGGYWAGKFEVTQKEYQKVMGSNPSAFGGERRPVDSVNWDDAMEFCRKLTEQDLKEKMLPEGYHYALPTEPEWEGLVGGSELKDAVTSQGGMREGTAAVGTLGANSFGLYDMRGNVSEFCLGDPSLPYRVLRGGSWQDWIEINLRLEFRTYCPPTERKNTYGFRCVLKAGAAAGAGGG
jgi:formylglycine-generating enzyme required for sulfatase activity